MELMFKEVLDRDRIVLTEEADKKTIRNFY
jgi:hypothetical protein